MKRLFFIFLIAFWPFITWAAVDTFEGEEITSSATIEGCASCDTIEGQEVTAAECSTPSDATVNEGFEGNGDGYENTWTETSTPNPDATVPAGCGSGCCSEAFSYTTADTAIFATYDVTNGTTMTVKLRFYVETWEAWDQVTLLVVGETVANFTLRFTLLDLEGNGWPDLRFGNGSTYYDYEDLSVDTWYTLEAKITTNATSYARLDGANEQSITANDYDINELYLGASQAYQATNVIIVDVIQWNYTIGYF